MTSNPTPEELRAEDAATDLVLFLDQWVDRHRLSRAEAQQLIDEAVATYPWHIGASFREE